MTEIEIVNPIPVNEVRPWLTNLSTALLGNPHGEEFDRRVARRERSWIPERTWGARTGGRWVGTLATDPRTITVPGPSGTTSVLAADALTGVSVNATHRRRGLLTSMITRSLAAAKERGDAVSLLIAAEWPIYGRFGYAPATRSANYTYYSRGPSAKVRPAEPGTVRQVDAAKLGELARGIHEAAGRARVGHLNRDQAWWARTLGLDGLEPTGTVPHYYVRDGADGPDGLLAWKVARDFDLDGSLGAAEVVDLITASDGAYRDLWAFLTGLDAIGEISLGNRSVDEQVRWMVDDGRALRQRYSGDFTWLRLLDVPAALAARCYAMPGTLTVEVTGDDLGYANGRFRLDADEQGARCEPTKAAADLRLSHRALAAVYLGGHRLAEVRAGGEVDELTPGAISRADLMFATTLAPWNPTSF